jgi:putative endonuclease
MALLYILQSERTGRFYIGSTENLARRLEEHRRGQTASTRGCGPWKLVYQEEFESLLAAHRRELEIKRWKSSKMIEALIREAVG